MPFFARQARYRLQHRYQDSGWENSDSEALADVHVAIRLAESRSRDAIVWGMCRVVELSSKMVIVEFPAGHPAYRVTIANGRVMLIEGDDAVVQDLSQQDRPADIYRWESSDSSAFGLQYPDIERVTATGPDLPSTDNRAPRGIRLRNRESGAD